MVWFKIDDGWWAHPKVLSVSDRAIALWARAGSWSSQQLTGGLIPASTLRLLGASKASAQELVSVGLWEQNGTSYLFHDWHVYNFDADSVQAKRDAESEGARLGNHVRWHVKRGLIVSGCEFCGSGTRSGGDQVPDGLPDSGANPPEPDPTQYPIDDDFPIGQSSSAIDPVDNSGLFDLERFRSERPDLDRLSDSTIRQLATNTLRRSPATVNNETGYVLRAAKDPTWVKRGDEIEWETLMDDRGGAA